MEQILSEKDAVSVGAEGEGGDRDDDNNHKLPETETEIETMDMRDTDSSETNISNPTPLASLSQDVKSDGEMNQNYTNNDNVLQTYAHNNNNNMDDIDSDNSHYSPSVQVKSEDSSEIPDQSVSYESISQNNMAQSDNDNIAATTTNNSTLSDIKMETPLETDIINDEMNPIPNCHSNTITITETGTGCNSSPAGILSSEALLSNDKVHDYSSNEILPSAMEEPTIDEIDDTTAKTAPVSDYETNIEEATAKDLTETTNPSNNIDQSNVEMKQSESNSSSAFRCVHKVSDEFSKTCGLDNYLRGCKWSPDQTQILTNSNDNILRTFTPGSNIMDSDTQMAPSCLIKESGLIYDFAWYPGKTDSKPDSCRVACSCPGSPIHLWDSNQSNLVSSYRAFDHCDEVISAYSLSFSPDGSKLYGGYKNSIRIFDTEYSHKNSANIKTFDTKTKEGHKGMISCFCHGPQQSNTFITGSYSRHVGVYYSLTNKLVCLIQGQQGGVTHIMMSPDGRQLYTGGRKDPEIVCWDMRNLGQVLCTYLRDVQTNQRIYFDLSRSGRYLVSGNHDGTVQVWDTLQPGQEVSGEVIKRPCHTFKAHEDCVNGVSFHPIGSLLVTASGQRHFNTEYSDDSDEDSSSNSAPQSNVKDFSLKLWSTPCFQ